MNELFPSSIQDNETKFINPSCVPPLFQTFTILFVCIAITSDLVCLFFIPINWLFFLASTYVWVQYVWHAGKYLLLSYRLLNYFFFSNENGSNCLWIFIWTAVEKGCCMPMIFLWTVFLYLEGAVRWRNDKTIPHIDLCRPFAAHW